MGDLPVTAAAAKEKPKRRRPSGRHNKRRGETKPANNGKHPGGRPPTYHPAMAAEAKLLCEHGLTDAEIAQFFGIGCRTIYGWMAHYPEFKQALHRSKEQVDDHVERKLYERAVGYDYEAEKIFLPAGSRKPVRVTYTEHVPPAIDAQARWLSSRRPTQWRTQGDVVVVGNTAPAPEIEDKRKRVLDGMFKMFEERIDEMHRRSPGTITINPRLEAPRKR